MIDISTEKKPFPDDHSWGLRGLSLQNHCTLGDCAGLETGKTVVLKSLTSFLGSHPFHMSKAT